METFLEELKLVLPVIGVDFLRKPISAKPPALGNEQEDQFFVLEHNKKGISALAKEVDGEFFVLKGAIGNLNEAISFDDKRQAFRNQIFESGRALKTGDYNFELQDDVAFSSPSAASVFLFGTSRNGRTDWLLQGELKTYGDWKDEQLSN